MDFSLLSGGPESAWFWRMTTGLLLAIAIILGILSIRPSLVYRKLVRSVFAIREYLAKLDTIDANITSLTGTTDQIHQGLSDLVTLSDNITRLSETTQTLTNKIVNLETQITSIKQSAETLLRDFSNIMSSTKCNLDESDIKRVYQSLEDLSERVSKLYREFEDHIHKQQRQMTVLSDSIYEINQSAPKTSPLNISELAAIALDDDSPEANELLKAYLSKLAQGNRRNRLSRYSDK